MKIKFLPLIAALFTVTPLVTSCLDNDEVVIDYGSETSITDFRLGTLKIDRIGKDKNGKDSAYVDTLDCSAYRFTINQADRTIENKDSLPMGVHLDKVIISKITADTEIIGYEKNGQDTTWTQTDSLDFTITPDHKLNFRVYTYDLKKGTQYKVTINRHKQDPDSITWKDFSDMTFGNAVIKQKAIFANNTLFVFGEYANGNPACLYTKVNKGTPSGWESLDLSPYDNIQASSATLWGESIYLKNQEGKIIAISTEEPQVTGYPYPNLTISNLIAPGIIAPKNETSFSCLFAVQKEGQVPVYGYIKEDVFITETTSDKVQFPENLPLFSVTEPMAHNNSLSQTTVLSFNNRGTNADTCALVFHRLSTDTKWSEFEANQSNGCPNMKDIVMFPYDGKLYAFGGKDEKRKKADKAFETFYISSDHGLTWQKAPEKQTLQKGFEQYAQRYDESQAGSFSCAVDNTDGNRFIWVIWKDGEVTRGRINRLGFLPKW